MLLAYVTQILYFAHYTRIGLFISALAYSCPQGSRTQVQVT